MEKSKFTGNLLDAILVYIVTYCIVVFTLGIGTPFAIVYNNKWFASHTFIEGNQLKFIGSDTELFKMWLLWLLLVILTLGIYGLLLKGKLRRWIIKNTVFNHRI